MHRLFPALVALVLAGCERSGEPRPTEANGARPTWTASCPMAVAGAQVAVEDTPEGVAMVFTAPGGDVAELRRRVHHVAQMYDDRMSDEDPTWWHMGRGPMMHGDGMGEMHGRMHGVGAGRLPPVDAEVDDVPGGARLELTPLDSADLVALRDRIQLHEAQMADGYCWMGQYPEPDRS